MSKSQMDKQHIFTQSNPMESWKWINYMTTQNNLDESEDQNTQ